MDSSLIRKYGNGNYVVKLYDDGTKVRFTNNSEFKPEFPESIDLKITNYCADACAYCHENSDTRGKRGSLEFDFLGNLTAGTELAIGGGDPLSHPDLPKFLNYMRDLGVVCNITLSRSQMNRYRNIIENFIDNYMIHGIGVSWNSYPNLHFKDVLTISPNVVIHLINGVAGIKDIYELFDRGLKVLILGYKDLGRGVSYRDTFQNTIKKNQKGLEDNMLKIIDKFDTVSFDNLALIQLKMKEKISKEDWELYYMGDDGKYSMYIDLVKEQFAKSSTSVNRVKGIKPTIEEMFKIVRNEGEY